MKILVTSSTGLTGKAVVRHLAAKGALVRAMIHSDRKQEEILLFFIIWVRTQNVYPKTTSRTIIRRNPAAKPTVPQLE